jgi:hypothetical protein
LNKNAFKEFGKIPPIRSGLDLGSAVDKSKMCMGTAYCIMEMVEDFTLT